MIDGAHIRAVPGHQTRHLDVKVGKVEVAGRTPRRFAFAPNGADRPLAILRATLSAQGWRPGQKVTVISDGEAYLPKLVRAATREPVRHILDWFHLSCACARSSGCYAGSLFVIFRLIRCRRLRRRSSVSGTCCVMADRRRRIRS